MTRRVFLALAAPRGKPFIEPADISEERQHVLEYLRQRMEWYADPTDEPGPQRAGYPAKVQAIRQLISRIEGA